MDWKDYEMSAMRALLKNAEAMLEVMNRDVELLRTSVKAAVAAAQNRTFNVNDFKTAEKIARELEHVRE